MAFPAFSDDTRPDARNGADENEPRWYACYTRARHEKKVDVLLRRRGMTTFLPLVERERKWADRTKRVEFPMFPGYLFCRFSLAAMYDVLVTPGVSTIIRFAGRPVAIPETEIENIRRFAEALSSSPVEAEPRPWVEEGRRVRVTSGPFEGVTGVVLERRGRKRVLVGVEAIRQGLEIDIGTHSLAPLGPVRQP